VTKVKSLAVDLNQESVGPNRTDVYDVTDDFARPVGISQACIAVIMTLLGDRLDRILFEGDDD
jgi:hypothetical protein